jgi:hypothetical protein
VAPERGFRRSCGLALHEFTTNVGKYGQWAPRQQIDVSSETNWYYGGALSSWGTGAMPIRPFVQSGAFEPEVVAAMSEAFDAACNEQPNVARGVIANRIIAAAKLGERDPVRLREAGLGKPD